MDKKPIRDRAPYEDESLVQGSRKRYAELGLPRSIKKRLTRSIVSRLGEHK